MNGQRRWSPFRIFGLRDWWPALAVVALAGLSVELLRVSYDRWHDVLHEAVSSTDNVSESRRRLMAAYLAQQRLAGGDPTFPVGTALPNLRAAEAALRDWSRGRSGIIGIEGSPQSDTTLLRLGRRYEAALAVFGTALAARPTDPVELRSTFSRAERAASALEAGVHAELREIVAAEERRHRLRLAGWGLLLVTAALGLAVAGRARSRAEAEQARSESRLSRLRALAPVGIVECGDNGRIHTANNAWCELTGQAESEWRGTPWWQAFGAVHRERAEALWKELIDTGVEHTAELRLTGSGDSGGTVERDTQGDANADARYAGADRDGDTWVLARTARGNPDPAGGARWVVTFTDITHRRRVEEQLHHAQKMEAVGRLAGGVAHDFNNLLTSLGGFATLAREAVPEDEPLHADLREIERGVERGRALTRQLLTFSRQERIQPEPLDLGAVVENLDRMLNRLVREDIDIRMHIAEEPAAVVADRGQLEQVVTNLVVNAADAITGGGKIRIDVKPVHLAESIAGARSEIQPGRYALLSVSDTGTGIPPAVRERMFEPFFTSKERGKGTGLGLSTVWAIVRQSGGHIHVYSEEGRGTIFRIYMPATAVPPRSREGATEPDPRSIAPGQEGTILVVEDEEAVRRLTRRVLQLRGWTVLEASDGAEALALVNTHDGPIDAVVTDVIMRGMGGVELAEELRARGHHIPTLFVSGYTDAELPLENADLLEKPFAPGTLAERVETMVRVNRAR